jgi:hypothetical protein
MKFMIIRKADANTEAWGLPNEQLVEDMMAYNEQLVRAGKMLAGDGLKPTSTGVRIRFGDGPPTVIDGPFTESKELIAGFTMIEAASRDEALEWVKRWPTSDGDGNVELELRQVFADEEFGDAATPEIREQNERLRAQVNARP